MKAGDEKCEEFSCHRWDVRAMRWDMRGVSIMLGKLKLKEE